MATPAEILTTDYLLLGAAERAIDMVGRFVRWSGAKPIRQVFSLV